MRKDLPVHKWKISKLKDNPEQAALFGDVTEEELEELAALMQNRLDHPIEIRSDGTIIAGHQRVRAAKLLGWKEIDVIVRTDLEAAGPDAVQAHFIYDNFARRHLSPLAKAKCIRRLMELEEGRKADRFSSTKMEALKVRIGKRMKLSERSVNRYLLALTTPLPVQQAFDEGQLTLIQTGKVAGLSERVQAQVAAELAKSQPIKEVLAKHLAKVTNNRPSAETALKHFLHALCEAKEDLGDRMSEILADGLDSDLTLLRESKELIDRVLARLEHNREESAKRWERLERDYGWKKPSFPQDEEE